MQKYSHNSRRVQKELGGDVYALSERVDSIEDDVARLEGYEETVLKSFTFDATTATEQTLKEVLENSEVHDWLSGTHKRDWTHFTIEGTGNDTLNGTYDYANSGTYSTMRRTGTVLNYKYIVTVSSGIAKAISSVLKANTSTGALSYGRTDLDITGSYTQINIQFKKGDLS